MFKIKQFINDMVSVGTKKLSRSPSVKKNIVQRSAAPPKGVIDRRVSNRIAVGDVISGTTVDPNFHSYIPFKAKVVNISKDGVQLAIAKGSVQIAEGTKVIIIPPSMKEVSGSSKEAVVIWIKDYGKYIVCGCMFTSGSSR